MALGSVLGAVLGSPLRNCHSYGGSSYPAGLLSLWGAKSGTMRGPQILTSVAGNQPDANGNMVPWPNYHPLRGVMVQPAFTALPVYSNLLENTGWVKSGTVTVDTTTGDLPEWLGGDRARKVTFAAGAYMYRAVTASAGVIQFVLRAKFISGGPFLQVAIRAADTSTARTWVNIQTGVVGSTTVAGTVSSAVLSVTNIGDGWYEIFASTISVGTGASFYLSMSASDASVPAAAGAAQLCRCFAANSGYSLPYVETEGSAVPVTSTAAASDGTGLAIPLNAQMTAALSGGAFTAAALVEMGVSSAQVTAPANILSVNDVAAGLIFADSGGKLKCTDGTNTAEVTVTGGWVRTDELLPVVQYNGTTFRIGYAKNTFSSITWGDAVAVGADGDWNVVTHERIGLNSTIVFGARQAQTWGKVASEAEVLKVAPMA